MASQIPSSLRIWFKVHFWVDMLFAIPLLIFPEWTLDLLMLSAESTVAARLVGAALIGIGGNSLLMNAAGREYYLTMLRLKMLWSGAAIIGLGLEAIANPSPSVVSLLGIFVGFTGLWHFYHAKLIS